MTLETIPSALLTAGSGGVAGFLIGFAIKKVFKFIAVIFGVILGALLYLQSQSIVSIDWNNLQSISESVITMLNNSANNTGLVSDVTANLGIPLTGGLSAGLVLGFSKG